MKLICVIHVKASSIMASYYRHPKFELVPFKYTMDKVFAVRVRKSSAPILPFKVIKTRG